MSIRALNWAWAQTTGNPTAKAVLAALADMADEEHSCWPSRELIAHRVEVSVSTVKRTIRELRAAGFVRTQRRYSGFGKQSSSRYFLAVEGIFEVAESSLEPLGVKLAPNGGEAEKPLISALEVNLTPNAENEPPLGVNCDPYIENPNEIDLSINHQEGEGATRPDDDLTEIDRQLAAIHPSLSATSIALRLRTVDPASVNLVAAARDIVARATNPVLSYPAFVAAGIERAPHAWPRVPAPSRRREQQALVRDRCAAGEHDWGPAWWPLFDRGHCVDCSVRRRDVDAEYALLEANDFERAI